MNTWKTNNRQNNYTLENPLYKKSKHQPMPIVANYALMLLKVYQDNQGGYTKKDLVGQALGHISDQYVTWNGWTNGAFCMEFSAFSTNMLLEYRKDQKLWFWGSRMTEYLKFHFGNHPDINLDGYPFNDAIEYNKKATAENAQAKKDYQIGKEIFFQDFA
jgi:hypothetical protein